MSAPSLHRESTDSLIGNDFRRAFSILGGLKALTSVPLMALTATASPETQEIISQSLQLVDPVVVSCCLNRANIYYSARAIKAYRVSVPVFPLTAYIQCMYMSLN